MKELYIKIHDKTVCRNWTQMLMSELPRETESRGVIPHCHHLSHYLCSYHNKSCLHQLLNPLATHPSYSKKSSWEKNQIWRPLKIDYFLPVIRSTFIDLWNLNQINNISIYLFTHWGMNTKHGHWFWNNQYLCKCVLLSFLKSRECWR